MESKYVLQMQVGCPMSVSWDYGGNSKCEIDPPDDVLHMKEEDLDAWLASRGVEVDYVNETSDAAFMRSQEGNRDNLLLLGATLEDEDVSQAFAWAQWHYDVNAYVFLSHCDGNIIYADEDDHLGLRVFDDQGFVMGEFERNTEFRLKWSKQSMACGELPAFDVGILRHRSDINHDNYE